MHRNVFSRFCRNLARSVWIIAKGSDFNSSTRTLVIEPDDTLYEKQSRVFELAGTIFEFSQRDVEGGLGPALNFDIPFAKHVKDGVNAVRLGMNDGKRNKREHGRQQGCGMGHAAPVDVKWQHTAFASGEGRSQSPGQRCSVGP